MMACLAPQATIWDIFQPQLVSRIDLEKYVESDFAQSAARGALTMNMHDMLTTVWGDAAIVRFYLDYQYAPPNAIAGSGRITCVLRQFPEAGWLVMHVHEGHVPDGIPRLRASN